VAVSPASRADNADGVLFRSHVVAYEVRERESLTGGSYGHLAPKCDAEPSRRGGVSARGPACGRGLTPVVVATSSDADFVVLDFVDQAVFVGNST